MCISCGEPIDGAQAISPSGPLHPRCAKIGTAHGQEIDISNGALFLRLMALEGEVKRLRREFDAADSYIQRPIGGERS